MPDDSTDPKTTEESVARWLKEIQVCKTREKDFRTDGQRILDIYDGTKAAETPFNILYSNTETLMPALYSATPRPVVQRRFKDDDPMGKAAAQAGQRALEFLLDTDSHTYETFDEALQRATMVALLPGRAHTCVKYDGDDTDEYQSETVCLDSKHWNRVYYGYAHKWIDVPWVAYRDNIDKKEAVRLFGQETANLLNYAGQDESDASFEDTKGKKEERHQGEAKLTEIYQIWSKADKTVYYVSEQVKERYLKEEEDPLGLPGFFNCPRPLAFLAKPHSLTPTALYILYESQAKELNELTRRIKAITKSIKAKGLYDGELGADLQKLVDAGEGELVPADKSASLAAEKGMQNAIWFFPVEKLILVVRELYAAREQCKQVIYEITGISDILRGASKASETLGAQEIKTQWGGLRLKRAQKEVARYACDLMTLMLEIAASKFNEETWARMTGLPFLLSAKFNELTKLAELLTQEVQGLQASIPPPQPGGPPPPVPPQIQQLQQIKQQLQAPKWSDVLAMLKDDLQRAYRIDIETNSTVELEAAEDQKLLNEVLMTLGQVLSGMGPLVMKGVVPFEGLQTLLLSIVRRSRLGTDLEDIIKAMQPPKPEDDGHAAEVAQLQQQMAQQTTQAQQQTAQQDLQVKTMTAEKALIEKNLDLQLREMEVKAAQDTLAMERQDFEKMKGLQQQVEALKIGPEVQQMEREKMANDKATEQMKAAIHKQTEIEKANIQASTQVEVACIGAQAKADQQATGGSAATPGSTAKTKVATLADVMKAVTAARKKTVIRGSDGRIAAVEETMADA